ncbi:MAG: AsmA-like C-terminal region-containing protein [Bacteroidota bacterium]
MKKLLRRSLQVLGLLVGLIVLALILIPLLFGPQIKEAVKGFINDEINAEVYFEGVGISIFKNFPNLTVTLDSFGIVGEEEFAGDTLIDVHHLGVVVNLFSLFGDEYEVNQITLEEPDIYAKVLKTGKPNWDIMQPATDTAATVASDTSSTESAPLALSLRAYRIAQGQIVYDDHASDMYLKIVNLNHNGRGDFQGDNYDFDTYTQADSVTFRLAGTTYLREAQVDADLILGIDNAASMYTLKENRIGFNALELHFDGWIKMPDDAITMDLKYNTNNNSFKGILSMVPGIYKQDFADIDTDGTFALDGWFKGTYSEHTLPGFQAHLGVTNGRFHYPDLPEEIKDINFDLKVACPDGNLNNLKLNFPQFRAMMGTAPLRGRLIASNLMSDNINLDAALKVSLDLATVDQFYPMEGQELRGKFSVDGTAQGVLNYPAGKYPLVNATMTLKDGYLKNSEFPSALEKMRLDAEMKNATGDLNGTTLDVNQFHTEIDGSPIDATLHVKDFDDPNYDLRLKGLLDLGKLIKIYPMEGTTLAGVLDLDLTTSGILSDIEKERYNKLPTSGSLKLTNVVYADGDYPMGFGVSDGLMTFAPRRLEIARWVGRAGSSPINVTGFLENYLAYFTLPDETLIGKMTLTSPKFNVNEWIVEPGQEAAAEVPVSEDGSPTEAEVPMEVYEVPAGIDFTFDSNLKTVLYDNLTLKDLRGQVILRDQEVRFKNLSFGTLGGNFRMTGGYNTQDISAPDVDLNMTLIDLDIPQLYQAFAIVQAVAPAAKFMSGKVNSSLNFKGKLLGDMSPDLASITSVGDLVINDGALNDFKPLKAVADKIKLPSLNTIKLNRTKILYEIHDGRVWVDPFDVPVAKGNMRVQGSNGIDQSMDYDLDFNLPAGAAGKAAMDAVAGLIKQPISGDGNLRALVGLGGTLSQPKIKYVKSAGKSTVADVKELVEEKVDSVKTVVKDTIKQVVTDTKDKAKEEARKQADALLKAAQAQADRIRAEAKKAADILRSEGEAQAKKTEESAKNPLERVAMKKAADLIRKQSQDKATKLEQEADQRAQKVIADARAKADALLK